MNGPPWSSTGKKIVVKTAEQYKAEAIGDDPWACPRCGCRRWRVLDTREEAATGNPRRTRYCLRCGKKGPRMITRETPDKFVLPDDLKDCA